jgi:hypothetical protein
VSLYRHGEDRKISSRLGQLSARPLLDLAQGYPGARSLSRQVESGDHGRAGVFAEPAKIVLRPRELWQLLCVCGGGGGPHRATVNSSTSGTG